jgi:hypothetical protein
VRIQRIDLSLEALIVATDEFKPLFTAEEIAICVARAEGL